MPDPNRVERNYFKTAGLRTDGGPIDGAVDQAGMQESASDLSNVQAAPVGSFIQSAPGAYPITRFRLHDDRRTRTDLTFYVKKPVGARYALLSAVADKDTITPTANEIPHVQAVGAIPCNADQVRDLLPDEPTHITVLYSGADSKTFTLITGTVDGEWAGIAGTTDTRAQILIHGNKAATDSTERFARIASLSVANGTITLDETYKGTLDATILNAWVWPGYQTARSIVGSRNRTDGLRPMILPFNDRAVALVPGDRPLVVKEGYAYPFGLRAPQQNLAYSAGTSAYLDAGNYEVFCFLTDARNNRTGPMQRPLTAGTLPVAVQASGKITVGTGDASTAGSFPKLATAFKKVFTVTVAKDTNNLYRKVTITAVVSPSGATLEERDLRREIRLVGEKAIDARESTNARIVRIESTGATGVFYVDQDLYDSTATGDKESETLHLWTEEYTHWGVGIRNENWGDVTFAGAIAKETAEDLDADVNYAGYAIGGTSTQTTEFYRNQTTISSEQYPLNGFACGAVAGRRLILGRRPRRALSNCKVQVTGASYPEAGFPCDGYPRSVVLDASTNPLYAYDEGRTIRINGQPYTIETVVSGTVAILAVDFMGTTNTSYEAEIAEETRWVYISNADEDICEAGNPIACTEVLAGTDDGLRAITVANSRAVLAVGAENSQYVNLTDWEDQRGGTLPLVAIRRDEEMLRTGTLGNQAVAVDADGYVYLWRGGRGIDRLRGRIVEKITFDRIQGFIDGLYDEKFPEACGTYWHEKEWVLYGNLYSSSANSYPDRVLIWDIRREQWFVWKDKRVTAFSTVPMRKIGSSTVSVTDTVTVEPDVGFDFPVFLYFESDGTFWGLRLVNAANASSTALATFSNPYYEKSSEYLGKDANGKHWILYGNAQQEYVGYVSGGAFTSVGQETATDDKAGYGAAIGNIDGDGAYFYSCKSTPADAFRLYKASASGVAAVGDAIAGAVTLRGLAWANDGDLVLFYYIDASDAKRIIKVNPATGAIRDGFPATLSMDGYKPKSLYCLHRAPNGKYYIIAQATANPYHSFLYSFDVTASGVENLAQGLDLGAYKALAPVFDTAGNMAVFSCQITGDPDASLLRFYNSSFSLTGSVNLITDADYPTTGLLAAHSTPGYFGLFAYVAGTPNVATFRVYKADGTLLTSTASSIDSGGSNAYYTRGWKTTSATERVASFDVFGTDLAICQGLQA